MKSIAKLFNTNEWYVFEVCGIPIIGAVMLDYVNEKYFKYNGVDWEEIHEENL